MFVISILYQLYGLGFTLPFYSCYLSVDFATEIIEMSRGLPWTA